MYLDIPHGCVIKANDPRVVEKSMVLKFQLMSLLFLVAITFKPIAGKDIKNRKNITVAMNFTIRKYKDIPIPNLSKSVFIEVEKQI